MPISIIPRSAAIHFLVIAAIFLFSTSMASAHAVLISSTPAQGERLVTGPRTVSLLFSETISRAELALVGTDGAKTPLETSVSGPGVSAQLTRNLPVGVYALNWKVLSEDGHPVSAAIIFAIGEDADVGAFRLQAAPTTISTLTWISKTVFYVTTLFGVGGVFFSNYVARRRAGTKLLLCLIVAATSGLSLFALLNVELTGNSFGDLLASSGWTAAASSSLARSLAAMIVVLTFACLGCSAIKLAYSASFVSFVLLGPAYALTGHASGAGVPFASFVMVFPACRGSFFLARFIAQFVVPSVFLTT